MKIKLIIGSMFLSIALLTVLIVIKQVPKTIELTIFEKAYNLVQFSDEEVIEIPIYINHRDTYLVNKSNISNLNINNNEDNVAFTVNSIIATEEINYFKNSKYYKYIFIIKPVVNIQDNFKLEMESAVLEINYNQGVKLNIKIGSFSYYYYKNDNNDISLKQLKGLVNTYKDKILVGVEIGLKNNSSKSIIIKNIIPLDVNLSSSLSEILVNINFNQSEKISDILGYQYDPYLELSNLEFSFELGLNTNFFVPLKYKHNQVINKLGFLIEYEIENELKYLCIDDFLFFDTSIYSIDKINNLIFYTYENY